MYNKLILTCKKRQEKMEWNDKMSMQCSKPKGKLGITVGKEMNKGHYELWKWGLSFINIKKNFTILDIGCGGGRALKLMAKMQKGVKIYAIDYSEDMVELAKETNKEDINSKIIEIRNGNVEKLEFSNEMFDLITAFEACYFWPNIIENLKHIKDKLKPNGKIILVNETYKNRTLSEEDYHIEKLLKIKHHTKNEFMDFLTRSGYKSVDIHEDLERNWITVIGNK